MTDDDRDYLNMISDTTAAARHPRTVRDLVRAFRGLTPEEMQAATTTVHPERMHMDPNDAAERFPGDAPPKQTPARVAARKRQDARREPAISIRLSGGELATAKRAAAREGKTLGQWAASEIRAIIHEHMASEAMEPANGSRYPNEGIDAEEARAEWEESR